MGNKFTKDALYQLSYNGLLGGDRFQNLHLGREFFPRHFLLKVPCPGQR